MLQKLLRLLLEEHLLVEMTEAAAIVHGATEASLVLMDEVGRGTSTFDGLALAWACAEHLARAVGAYTLFATHFFELTALAEALEGVANVHLDAVEHGHDLVFLHAVEDGPASQSYGIQVARLAGVPAKVIAAAKKRLKELEEAQFQQGPQGDLFVQAAEDKNAAPDAALLEALHALKPDEMSPKEALEALYALVELSRP